MRIYKKLGNNTAVASKFLSMPPAGKALPRAKYGHSLVRVYGFVPAYQPTAKKEDDTTDYSDAVFPDEVLRSPAAYAISNRNRWLVKQADIVITYVTGIGYSADFKFMAERKNKEIIELSKLEDLIE